MKQLKAYCEALKDAALKRPEWFPGNSLSILDVSGPWAELPALREYTKASRRKLNRAEVVAS